jgi:hypothetical protein
MRQGLVPLVLPTYAPETGAALGAALIYYRRPEADRLPISGVKLGVVATQEHQFSLSTVADQYLAERSLRLSFTGSARRFPDYFWAVGPNAPESSREKYRRDELTGELGLLSCRKSGLCVGPSVWFERFRIEDKAATGVLSSGQVDGSSGTTDWTGGLHLELDGRDSQYYSHTGGLTVLKAGVGRAAYALEGHTLGRLDLDARRFFQLYGEHVLAIQIMAQFRTGAVPFELMPMLGGDALLRGYYQGRYRAKQLLALQLEYRFPLLWRFGGVLFGGTGEVAPDVSALASGSLHSAGGTGLRLTLDRDEHINLRIDVAIRQGGETSGYLSISEAF